MAPEAGFEPATHRLTVCSSTTEPFRNLIYRYRYIIPIFFYLYNLFTFLKMRPRAGFSPVKGISPYPNSDTLLPYDLDVTSADAH